LRTIFPKSLGTSKGCKGEPVETIRSKDGTTIAFDRLGDGPPVIVVGGLLCDQALTRPTAEELAQHCIVFNYDRRGRGDSGDTLPYAVEREIEDIGALIAEAGETASVYGLPITKLVLHEPPYVPDDEEARRNSQEIGEKFKTLLAEDHRGDAVELALTMAGMPAEMVGQMRNEPWWAGLEAMAPTLAYDSEVMGEITAGAARFRPTWSVA
jgi:pimeloyl-ACP methyl ester carboxylesterase